MNNLTKNIYLLFCTYGNFINSRKYIYAETKHKKIIEIVQDKLTCSSHNLDHVFRVYNLCLLLAKYEKDVDLKILITSLLHDITRVE